jgi:hypothetical protein
MGVKCMPIFIASLSTYSSSVAFYPKVKDLYNMFNPSKLWIERRSLFSGFASAKHDSRLTVLDFIA